SQPGFYVTANLYLPTTGQPPFPGVLFPLGHERGGKSNATWQQVLVTLARRGYVGMTWDTIGQGERVQLFDVDFEEAKVASSTTASRWPCRVAISLRGAVCSRPSDHRTRSSASRRG